MSPARRIGISYGRFSDPNKQSGGDSEGRQERDYRDFCGRHNLTPLTEVFMDRGRSGYSDAHRKKGRLGVLIAYAKDGRFDPGDVIVIEAWDRLGRLRPDKQIDLVRELLETGVDIGVCRLNDVFTLEDFGTHKWIVLSTFIMLAYQESKQKAERVSASYETRRKLAREGKLMLPRKADGRTSKLVTDRLPYWLETFGDGCRPIPERAAAVKRIFALAAQGQGRSRIVATLIAEKRLSFGKGKTWTRSYVGRILTDRRVLGEYQPRRTDDTPDGAPIAKYYSAVISEKEWHLARAGQEERRTKDSRGRVLARTERKHVNLFRSMLTHAADGEGFFLHGKMEGNGNVCRHVLCNHAGPGGHARTVTFPYHVFERAILELLKEVDPKDVLPKAKDAVSKADVLRAKLKNLQADVASLQADLKAGYSKALATVLRDKEIEEQAVADDLQEELARSVRPAAKAWDDLPSLADLVQREGNEARLKLRPVLRRIIDDAFLVLIRRRSFMLCAIQFDFHGGARRHYLILNQSAGNGRPNACWAGSLATVAEVDELDLRKRDDVKEMEGYLSNLDIEARKKDMLPRIELI
jgi:DNA invertase Pin-like site-specific DNA recombinase